MRAGSARDVAAAAACLAVLLILPALLPGKAFTDFMIRLAAMGVFATSLNLLVGYGGLVSFGHGMFYGLGAYAFGLLMQDTLLPMPVALLATIATVLAVAVLVGAICIRLRQIYFAFCTLAMQMLFYSVIISAVGLTGGDQGLRGGIPRLSLWSWNLATQSNQYIFACIVLVLSLLALRHIVSSPFGISLRMVRDNEPRAAFLGLSVWRIKLAAFVISAGFAGLGGVVISLFLAGAYPELANWPLSGQAIFAIMLGGLDSFLGPLLGVMILQVLNDVVTRFTEYYGLALGLVILAFTLGLRRGLLDFLAERVRLIRSSGRERTPEPAGLRSR